MRATACCRPTALPFTSGGSIADVAFNEVNKLYDNGFIPAHVMLRLKDEIAVAVDVARMHFFDAESRVTRSA
jgi:hypothetical protein